MYLLPAIDILDGRAVRLAKGDYAQVTVYNDDPVDQARKFEAQGATWIHVVDLDGARTGVSENIDIGAARMVLGTALVNDPELACAAVERVGGDRLTAGIDAKGGEVAVSGWIEGSGVAACDLAREMGKAGFKHIVYTDIARDGMQTGLDVRAYVQMAEAFGHPVIASGGVASVSDIERLAPVASSIEGVITGRAVYEGTLTVEEGVAACAAATKE